MKEALHSELYAEGEEISKMLAGLKNQQKKGSEQRAENIRNRYSELLVQLSKS